MTFKNYFSKKIAWIDPLEVAFNIYNNEDYMCFLYSSKVTEEAYRSYIAYSPIEHLKGNNFDEILKIGNNQWFGYLGYDLKNSLEKLPIEELSTNELPEIWLIKYQFIIEFDHLTKTIEFFYLNNMDETY